MIFHDKLEVFLKKELKQELTLEIPPDLAMGDAALPCFALAKAKKKPPQQVAKDLAAKLKKPKFVERIEAKGPYVNFFFKKDALAEKTLLDIAYQKDKYGRSTAGKGKKVNRNCKNHQNSSSRQSCSFLLEQSSPIEGYKAHQQEWQKDFDRRIPIEAYPPHHTGSNKPPGTV